MLKLKTFESVDESTARSVLSDLDRADELIRQVQKRVKGIIYDLYSDSESEKWADKINDSYYKLRGDVNILRGILFGNGD